MEPTLDDPFGSTMPTNEASDAEKARLIGAYLELTGQIKKLEADLDQVKDAIRGWLEDGELVSDGKHYATIQFRKSYIYDEAKFKTQMPYLYERVVSVDSKKIKEALSSELVSEQELDEVRSLKETQALTIRPVEP